jgi:hypothetical protein
MWTNQLDSSTSSFFLAKKHQNSPITRNNCQNVHAEREEARAEREEAHAEREEVHAEGRKPM